MSRIARRSRPEIEGLETRETPGGAGPIASLPLPPGVEGRRDTLSVLQAFTQHYPSRAGQPGYDPRFDLNHNGRVGQDDGRLLMAALPKLSPPNARLTLKLALAPADQARGPLPANSGGVTHSHAPTIVGLTTPGSLVFTGSGTVDLKLKGPAVVADASGHFAYKFALKDGINQLDLLAVDPYGHQVLRAFPVYWLEFARYTAAHPTPG